MTEITGKVKRMMKNTKRGQRLLRSKGARSRRKDTKDIVEERTENLFSKLRRLRKKNKGK